MKNEKCESKVSNLLAGLDSLDDEDVKGKIRLLVEAIEILDNNDTARDYKGVKH